jgi:hypothetical protein
MKFIAEECRVKDRIEPAALQESAGMNFNPDRRSHASTRRFASGLSRATVRRSASRH